MFLPRKDSKTCLQYELSVENVKTIDDKKNSYEVISIMPQMKKSLTQTSQLKLSVTFNKKLALEDLIPQGDFDATLPRLCYLTNSNSPSGVTPLYPSKALLN